MHMRYVTLSILIVISFITLGYCSNSFNLTVYQEGNKIILEINSPSEYVMANVALMKDNVQVASKKITGIGHIKSSFNINEFGNYTLKVYDINKKETATVSISTKEILIHSSNEPIKQEGAILFNNNYLLVGTVLIIIVLIILLFKFLRKHVNRKK